MIEWYFNVNWILILVTQKSPIGYGYVLTLDEVSYHGNMLKSCCHDILCKHKLFLFSMHHPDNQIVIFKVSSKNVNEKLTYNDERQMY